MVTKYRIVSTIATTAVCIVAAWLIAGLFTVTTEAAVVGNAVQAAPTTRLVEANIVHIGAFRVPSVTANGTNYAYGGEALAFNPVSGNSIFLSGHVHQQKVAELSIPNPLGTGGIGTLPIAKFVQPFTEITGGKMQIGGGNTRQHLGGLLVDKANKRLIWDCYIYYDAAVSQTTSHGYCSLDFSNLNAQGQFKLGTIAPGALAGGMCDVPASWETQLGFPAMTGQCGITIVGRTSSGPAFVGFNPKDLGVKVPAPIQAFAHYPYNTPLASPQTQNALWNRAARPGGAAFPEANGKAAALYFGTRGTGPYWYGDATTIKNGITYVDKFDPSKGEHSPPYVPTIWFYDPADFMLVKAGTKKAYELRPYLVTAIPGLYSVGGWHSGVGGVGYDEVNHRIYVAQWGADAPAGDRRPVIHVYEVK